MDINGIITQSGDYSAMVPTFKSTYFSKFYKKNNIFKMYCKKTTAFF
jgi:hypothetical protein